MVFVRVEFENLPVLPKESRKLFRPGSWTTDDDAIDIGDVGRSNAVEDAIVDSTVSDDDEGSVDDVIGNTTVYIVAEVYKTKAAVDAMGDSAIGDEDVANLRADAVFGEMAMGSWMEWR